MDRNAFINNVLSLYPHAIKAANVHFETYRRALSGIDVNFEKLYTRFAQEFKESFPPAPGWLKDLALEVQKEEKMLLPQAQWQHVKVRTPTGAIRNTDCFPATASLEVIKATYRKIFGCDDFEIVEVV